MRLRILHSPFCTLLICCLFYLAAPVVVPAASFSSAEASPREISRTRLLSAGQLSLYRHVTDGPAVPFEESYAPDTAQRIEWFLFKEDTEQEVQVTPYNYKSVLKLLLADRPDLVEKLGQKGYRFQDIQSIVEAYNRTW